MKNINMELPSTKQIQDISFASLGEVTSFNINDWEKVILSQREINEKVDNDWETKKRNWNLAIITESVELLDSIDWPWWKNKKTDWDNVTVEMIDTFTFLLSHLIEQKMENLIVPYISIREMENAKNPVIIKKDKELEEFVLNKMSVDFLRSILMGNVLSTFIIWFDVWYSLGFNITDLFKFYFTKNCLNLFRQNHGYKEGTYQKIWHGEEDNAILNRVIIDIDYDDNFQDNVNFQIDQIYNSLDKQEMEKEQKNILDFIESSERWKLFLNMVPEGTKNILLEFSEEYANYLA